MSSLACYITRARLLNHDSLSRVCNYSSLYAASITKMFMSAVVISSFTSQSFNGVRRIQLLGLAIAL